MAELYLSAILNVPQGFVSKFIHQQFELMAEMLEIIIEEFKDNQYLMNNMEIVLNKLLNYSTNQEILFFRKLVMKNQNLLDSIRSCPFGQKLMEEWELV